MIKIEKKNDSITLKISSHVELVSPLAEALHAFCLAATDSESCAFEVQCAAVEAVNNIILHAYNKDVYNDIIVQCHKKNSSLFIEIIDYGLSMSSLSIPSLPAFDAENGRGWWIIHSCVDDYYYKVIECIERQRLYKPDDSSNYCEDIIVKSHSNVLTLIKKF
jgi:anti-sigma regulatory factor (Ser/Thr protein kinase)